jgi:hypothetical protein
VIYDVTHLILIVTFMLTPYLSLSLTKLLLYFNWAFSNIAIVATIMGARIRTLKEIAMFKLITTTLVAVVGLGTAQASADYLSREFQLVNRSNETITEVLASNIKDSAFIPVDLLGNETVGPHESMRIAPFNDDGWCRFDVRMTFDDGLQQDVYDVNLCEATKLTTYGYRNDGNVRVSYN